MRKRCAQHIVAHPKGDYRFHCDEADMKRFSKITRPFMDDLTTRAVGERERVDVTMTFAPQLRGAALSRDAIELIHLGYITTFDQAVGVSKNIADGVATALKASAGAAGGAAAAPRQRRKLEHELPAGALVLVELAARGDGKA